MDASRVLAGPFCGQMLGDLGADVIKLERPGSGDETRGWGPPFHGDLSAYFISCNRNKRSLAIDLATDAGRQLFYRLVERSDVLLENFRSASAEKLGLSPAQLHERHPRLIICSISGFGRTGSWSDLPGYDLAVQALSGLMSITGPEQGPPCKVGVAVTDVLTGLNAAVAVLACLRAREQSGHGYAIDLALLDCALAAQVNVVQAYLTSARMPKRQGNAHLQIVPYQLFATADGWLVLAVGNDGQWQRFCQIAGRDDLARDERFLTNTSRVQHRATLIPMVEELLRGRPSKTWQSLLQEANIPHAPVLDYPQLLAEPHIAERGVRVSVRDPQGRPIDMIGSPLRIAGVDLSPHLPPPLLAEHTDEVLHEVLDMTDADIKDLRRREIIGG